MEENSKSLKVKAFACNDEASLEGYINDWLAKNNVTVLSIKYSSSLAQSDNGTIFFSALIVYRP